MSSSAKASQEAGLCGLIIQALLRAEVAAFFCRSCFAELWFFPWVLPCICRTGSVYESFIFYVSYKHLSLCSLPFHFLNGNLRGTKLLNMNTVKFYQGFPLYLLSFASWEIFSYLKIQKKLPCFHNAVWYYINFLFLTNLHYWLLASSQLNPLNI